MIIQYIAASCSKNTFLKKSKKIEDTTLQMSNSHGNIATRESLPQHVYLVFPLQVLPYFQRSSYSQFAYIKSHAMSNPLCLIQILRMSI